MNLALSLIPVTLILTCIVIILFLIHYQLVNIRIEVTKMRVQASIKNDWIEIKDDKYRK